MEVGLLPSAAPSSSHALIPTARRGDVCPGRDQMVPTPQQAAVQNADKSIDLPGMPFLMLRRAIACVSCIDMSP